MPFKREEIERNLISKFNFRPKESGHGKHHIYYSIKIGDLPLITTHVSHTKKEISKDVIGSMAKQVRVEASFFKEMLSCDKSCSDYYEKVANDPYPPFDIPSWKL